MLQNGYGALSPMKRNLRKRKKVDFQRKKNTTNQSVKSVGQRRRKP